MNWSMQCEREATAAPDDVFRYCADPATWGAWAHNSAWGKGLVVRGQYTRMLETETHRVAELAAGDPSPWTSTPQRSAARAWQPPGVSILPERR
jgi:hypothetical protein